RGLSGVARLGGWLVEEPAEGGGAELGELELAQGARLDLPDAFAGDADELADLFEGVLVPVGSEALAEPDDLGFAVLELIEGGVQAFAEELVGGGVDGGGVVVGEQVAEGGFAVVADGRLEAGGV